MNMPSILESSVDWRLDLLRSEPAKKIQLTCTGDVLDTLFFSNDAMPFLHAEAAISDAISAYWAILGHAACNFSSEEWRLLDEYFSPLDDEGAHVTAREASVRLEDQYSGSNYSADVLAFKELLPKIAALSGADFAAVKDILRLLKNLSSNDPFFTISRKLRPLEQCAAPRGI